MARQQALACLPDEAAPYLSEPASDYLSRGGKGIRPALCLATCGAYGGDVERALPTAAALELLHTAFLVHDDVEDDSHLRRGEPTLHRRFGRGLAVNTGDALGVFALSALRANRRALGTSLASRIGSEFLFMARQTVEGQALELGWERDGRLDLTPVDYLDLIMRKTCWYTTVLPLRAGALIGTGRSLDLTKHLRFGFFLGAAFQIRDDILNLTGDERYGKEILGDIREGKRTLMLIHLLAAASGSTALHLHRFLRLPREERTDEMVAEVFQSMQEHGSVAFADQFAHGLARSAGVAFEAAFGDLPDSADRRFIRSLITYMVDRDR